MGKIGPVPKAYLLYKFLVWQKWLRNCYCNECQNLTFGRHPIPAISGLFVFSDRTVRPAKYEFHIHHQAFVV